MATTVQHLIGRPTSVPVNGTSPCCPPGMPPRMVLICTICLARGPLPPRLLGRRARRYPVGGYRDEDGVSTRNPGSRTVETGVTADKTERHRPAVGSVPETRTTFLALLDMPFRLEIPPRS